MPRPSPQTERVIAITRLLAAHPDEGFTITDLARRLRMNKATFYPMVVALAEAGWLVRDPWTKTYRLGPELISLGEAAARSLPAVPLARPAMVELATELGVTCAAFTVADGIVTLVDQVWDPRSSGQPLQLGLWARLRAPYGAVFVAWDEEALDAWVADDDARPYRRAIEATRARGYVVELRVTPGPPVTGTGSVAAMLDADPDFLLDDIDKKATYAVATIEAPVFDAPMRVAMSLVLVGLPRTMTGREIDAYGKRLVDAAAVVTSILRP